MQKYPKIYSPFNRNTEVGPNRNKLIVGDWSRPEFEYLANVPWLFTEKIDGTNIRIHWDGFQVRFGGRTDDAQIPVKLLNVLQDLFREELFEQQFGGTEVTLFGEGYGAGIQKGGGNYAKEPNFALFDVLIDGWWLQYNNIRDVAWKMGINAVPLAFQGSLLAAVDNVRNGYKSTFGDFTAEGLVGVTKTGLLDRSGERLMVKIKTKDF